MADKADKIFATVICIIAITAMIVGIRYTFKDKEIHKETFEGHTYIFYGDKPVEHDVERKKCLDRFD